MTLPIISEMEKKMGEEIVNIILNCTFPSNDQMKVVREIRKQVPSIFSTYTSEIIGAVREEVEKAVMYSVDKENILSLLDKFIEKIK